MYLLRRKQNKIKNDISMAEDGLKSAQKLAHFYSDGRSVEKLNNAKAKEIKFATKVKVLMDDLDKVSVSEHEISLHTSTNVPFSRVSQNQVPSSSNSTNPLNKVSVCRMMNYPTNKPPQVVVTATLGNRRKIETPMDKDESPAFTPQRDLTIKYLYDEFSKSYNINSKTEYDVGGVNIHTSLIPVTECIDKIVKPKEDTDTSWDHVFFAKSSGSNTLIELEDVYTPDTQDVGSVNNQLYLANRKMLITINLDTGKVLKYKITPGVGIVWQPRFFSALSKKFIVLLYFYLSNGIQNMHMYAFSLQENRFVHQHGIVTDDLFGNNSLLSEIAPTSQYFVYGQQEPRLYDEKVYGKMTRRTGQLIDEDKSDFYNNLGKPKWTSSTEHEFEVMDRTDQIHFVHRTFNYKFELPVDFFFEQDGEKRLEMLSLPPRTRSPMTSTVFRTRNPLPRNYETGEPFIWSSAGNTFLCFDKNAPAQPIKHYTTQYCRGPIQDHDTPDIYNGFVPSCGTYGDRPHRHHYEKKTLPPVQQGRKELVEEDSQSPPTMFDMRYLLSQDTNVDDSWSQTFVVKGCSLAPHGITPVPQNRIKPNSNLRNVRALEKQMKVGIPSCILSMVPLSWIDPDIVEHVKVGGEQTAIRRENFAFLVLGTNGVNDAYELFVCLVNYSRHCATYYPVTSNIDVLTRCHRNGIHKFKLIRVNNCNYDVGLLRYERKSKNNICEWCPKSYHPIEIQKKREKSAFINNAARNIALLQYANTHHFSSASFNDCDDWLSLNSCN